MILFNRGRNSVTLNNNFVEIDAKMHSFYYAGIRRHEICPYATPIRQQRPSPYAGISGVMYMDSSLELLS